MRLILGVLDVAYSEPSPYATKQGPQKETTTGYVAEILEKNYGVMATFFELYRDKIAGILADSVAASIQDLINGGPIKSPTFGGEQKIESLFREFIYSNTMQKILDAAGQSSGVGGIVGVGGVVSKAAQRGVSNRKMKPNAKRAPRPAFVDSGLYVASFRAWVSAQ